MIKSVTDIFEELLDRVEPMHRTATATLEGLDINVKVLDARLVWNKIQVKITPLSGSGEKWIDAERLTKRTK